MPLGPIAPGGANKAVVPVNIYDIITERAVVKGVEDLHSQAALQHRDEKCGFDFVLRVLCGDCEQPTASVWSRYQAEVGLVRKVCSRGVLQVVESLVVNVL